MPAIYNAYMEIAIQSRNNISYMGLYVTTYPHTYTYARMHTHTHTCTHTHTHTHTHTCTTHTTQARRSSESA